jgi:hypothetical protein
VKEVDSIRGSKPDPNEIDESDRQYKKHDEQRISTCRGIVIDLRAESLNADDSMRFNRESFSNESEGQNEKHDEQRISILKGIVISWSQPKY